MQKKNNPTHKIFSLKKTINLLFIIVLIYLLFTSIKIAFLEKKPELFLTQISIMILLLFFLYDLINYYRFYTNQKTLINNKIDFKTSTIQIEVSKRDYETIPMMKNNKAKIKPKPYNINCKYILTENYLILYCQFRILEIFKYSHVPILIMFNDCLKIPFKYKHRFQLLELQIIDNQLLINNFKNHSGIKYLKIKNFTSIKENSSQTTTE